MEADTESTPTAVPWLPLTPGRAARMAVFRRGWLAVIALLTSALIGGAAWRLVHVGWFPAVEEAILRMPPGAALDGGVLKWPEGGRRMLADNMYLSAAGGAEADAPGVQAADLHVEFTSRAVWITWMAGHLRLAYPAGYVIDLDPGVLDPLWRAWRPHLYAAVFLGTTLLTWLVWGMMALVLAPVLSGMGRVLGRRAGLVTGWWVAVASFLPGSALLAVAIYLYGFRYLSLPVALGVLLLLLGITVPMLLIAPWCLPRQGTETPFDEPDREPTHEPQPGNPFAGAEEEPEEEEEEHQDEDGDEDQDEDEGGRFQ
ncbi:MAG: hypothetical protein H7A46_20985 [Verrucomicrobiales bacterium]|nr:hypothetical protein [Verrucomicrobiales bacterium]